MTERIHAPWTDDQVAALNAFQRSGVMHPFTCLGGQHRMRPTLIAEADGWHCPDEACGYRQDWAHAFMVVPVAIAQLTQARITPPTFAANPALAELARVREQLRATEFDLGQTRQLVVSLSERLTAQEKVSEALRIELRMIEAARRIPAQPPDPDGGLCDPIFREKPVRDVGSVDAFDERLIVSGPDSVTLTEAVLRGDL